MALSETERAAAAAIVNGWLWQPAEGHNYRFRYATRTLTRFCEAASLQPDEMRLVIEFLRGQEVGDGGISLMNRMVDLGTGWKAKDAWYQTMPGERWGNTESTKVRIYQVLFQAPADAKDGDGPYLVENGCQYRVSHTFYWDVEALPSVPASESGVAYALQGVTRDRETGLFSCVIERRERVQQDVAEYVSSETAFATTKDEQHLGVKAGKVAAAGKAARVGGGTMVRRRVSKNADCTSDVQNETVVEKPVKGASVEYRKTLRGTSKRTVDRNQPAALNGSGLKIGEMRRSEKTDGGLWNNETQQTTAEPAGVIGASCAAGGLTHADATTENVAAKPTVEQGAPGVNEELRAEARRTEDGTWDVSRTRIVYTPKSTGALTGGSPIVRTEAVVGVNQPTVPTGGPGGVNVVRRVSATPNDHGSFSTSEETTTYSPAQQTVTGGTTSQQETVETGINQPTAPKGAPGVNRRADVSVSLNDHGSMTTQKRTIVYVPGKAVATGGTVSQQETIETGIHQVSAPTGAPGLNRREDVSVSLNDHGSMTTQKRTIVYAPAAVTAISGWATERVTRRTTANDTNLAPSTSMGEASATPNDHGTATTSVAQYTPIPVDSGWLKWESTTKTQRGTYKYRHGIRIFCNQTTPPVPPRGSNTSCNIHINKFGRYDGSIVYSDLYEWVEDSGGGSSEGGSVGGTATLDQYKHDALGRTWKRTITVPTRTYYGGGHEGAEASDQANERHVEGLMLKGHTYAVGAPIEGAWTLQS